MIEWYDVGGSNDELVARCNDEKAKKISRAKDTVILAPYVERVPTRGKLSHGKWVKLKYA